MKYEMIFGDEKLFDGAPESATHAVKGGGFYSVKNKFVSYVSSGIFNGSNVEALGGYLIAERRIIKEPKQWTLEDKKAGRLPEVVAKYAYDGVEVTCRHINKAGDICGHAKNGDVWCQSINEITPIETPEEKARRERDEWSKKASQFIDDELDCVNLVGEHVMRRFYNAMLSGELPVPVAPEQNK